MSGTRQANSQAGLGKRLQRMGCSEFRPWERVWNILLFGFLIFEWLLFLRTRIDLLRLTFLVGQTENICGRQQEKKGYRKQDGPGSEIREEILKLLGFVFFLLLFLSEEHIAAELKANVLPYKSTERL